MIAGWNGKIRENPGKNGKKVILIILITACLQIHTRIITVSVTRLCSLLGLELMVKLRTLLTVFTFILKAEARDYGKGHYISDAACQVKSSHLYLHSAFNNTNCDKATAQYQNGKIVSIM